MAEVAALALATASAVFTAYFTAVTAVANITSAYQAYRTNHPKVNTTGAKSDYVKQHFGYDIKLLQQQNLFYTNYTYLLPEIRQAPKRRLSARFKKLLSGNRLSMSRNKSPSRPEPEPELGGVLKVTEIQKVPDTPVDNFVGLNTGKQPMYNIAKAEIHWATFQDGTACLNNAAPTIAVFNWTTQVITMFVKNPEWEKGMFFRNYQVLNSNLALFATEFQQRAVFTRIMKESSLLGTDSPIYLAEDDRTCKLKSTNSWNILGIRGDTGKEFMFLEMVRAAVFRLIECIYEDPTLVNVDMLDGGNGSEKEFVHVDTPDKVKLSYKHDNLFNVFAFNASEYSKKRVFADATLRNTETESKE